MRLEDDERSLLVWLGVFFIGIILPDLIKYAYRGLAKLAKWLLRRRG